MANAATLQAGPPSTRPDVGGAVGAIHGSVSFEAAGQLTPAPDRTRVVAYLASHDALDSRPPEGHATVAQKNKSFVPNFVVVQRGTEVEFPNFDDFDHNVFSLSKAAPSFDLDRYPRGKSKSRTFDKTGVVQVFCNIHPSMRALVLVTPNAWFARVDERGQFTIENGPPGSYQLVLWSDRCAEQVVPVTVTGGNDAPLAVTLHPARRSVAAAEAPPESPRGAYGVERGLGVKRECLNCPVVRESHDAKDPEPK
jgi:plastocyanin